MFRFAIFFALFTLTAGCATTTQTASERREAAYAQLIETEVPDGASLTPKKVKEGPSMELTRTTRVLVASPIQTPSPTATKTGTWVAGQKSTDPDDRPLVAKPGEIIEISFE